MAAVSVKAVLVAIWKARWHSNDSGTAGRLDLRVTVSGLTPLASLTFGKNVVSSGYDCPRLAEDASKSIIAAWDLVSFFVMAKLYPVMKAMSGFCWIDQTIYLGLWLKTSRARLAGQH